MRGLSRPPTAKLSPDRVRKSSIAPKTVPRKTAVLASKSAKPFNLLDLRNDDVIVRPKTTMGITKPTIMPIHEFLKHSRKLAKEAEKAQETPAVREAAELANRVTNPKEWLVVFIRNNLSNAAATLIQRTWRTYKIKKMWGGIFNNRIWTRHDILMRVFLGWRGYATKKFDTQVYCYNKFAALHKEKPWISIKTNLSPFNLFYATGRWFYPKLFNARTFLYVYRVFSRPEGRHILGIWKMIASGLRGYRENSHKFIHTVHKRQAFGSAFIAFELWHRYILWKKENKIRANCFSLQVKERIINWDIVEQRLNKRKAQRSLADAHYISTIRKNAYMAIHQHLVERRQVAMDMESALTFYNHRIMEDCRRAWIKYDNMCRHRRAELLKMQKGWYTYVFDKASKNHIITTMTTFRNSLLCSYCFTMWRKNIRYTALRLLKGAYLMFRNPSPFRQLFFAFRNDTSFIFFERAFREWVNYWRRRKAWKNFQKVFQKCDEKRELKQLCFYSLKRAAEINLIRRLVHVIPRYFPNQTYYSVEGMEKNLNLYFDSNSTFKYEVNTYQQQPPSDLLIRSFIFVVDKTRNFDRCKFAVNNKDKKMTPRFGYYNYFDIKRNFHQNVDILRVGLNARMARDRTTLTGVDSHHMAKKLAEVLPGFTTSESDSSNALVVTGLNKAIPLNIPEDIELSIDHLIEETENITFAVPKQVQQNFAILRKSFDARLRHPNAIYGNDLATPEISFLAGQTPNSTQSPMVEQGIPLIASKKTFGNSVTQFSKPIVETVPFESPSLPFVLELQSTKDDSSSMISTTIELFDTFNSQVLKPSLEKADPFISLRRFFLAITGMRFELKPTEPPQMDPSIRRVFRRNVNAFVAGLMGVEISGKGVPITLERPDWIQRYVNAAIAMHCELSKHPALFSFCAQVPFANMLIVDCDDAIEIRSFTYNVLVSKYPKLQKKNNEGLRRNATDSDEMKRSDLNAGLILLPYIVRPDLVKDFIKEEIKQ